METKLNGMQAKKEKRFKPQKQKAIIQPDLHFDIPKEEEEEPIEDVAPRNRPANTFFDDLEQVETLIFRLSQCNAHANSDQDILKIARLQSQEKESLLCIAHYCAHSTKAATKRAASDISHNA